MSSISDVLDVFAKKCDIKVDDVRLQNLKTDIKSIAKTSFLTRDHAAHVTKELLVKAFTIAGVAPDSKETDAIFGFWTEATNNGKNPDGSSSSGSNPAATSRGDAWGAEFSLTPRDLEYVSARSVVKRIEPCEFDLGEFDDLDYLVPAILAIDIPEIVPFQTAHPQYIQQGLMICTNSNNAPNFLFLEGHLGNGNKNSAQVAAILRIFEAGWKGNKRHAIRLRGPSGSGKTKAIYDVAREVFVIYLDWSQTQVSDMSVFKSRVAGYKKIYKMDEFEDACLYELLLLFAGRITVLHLLFATQRFDPATSMFEWLLLQLNGLVSTGGYYFQLLCPIRNYLRKKYPSTGALQEYFNNVSALSVHPQRACPSALVVAHDEVNALVSVLKDSFWSADKKSLRPLITFVLNSSYNLNGPEVIVSGTNRIKDHWDYFNSYFLKTKEERARVSHDINMEAFSSCDAQTLLSALMVNLGYPLMTQISQDGTRPRIITHYVGIVATGCFSGITMQGHPQAIYDQYRKYVVEGLPAGVEDQISLQYLVREFAVHAGVTYLWQLILKDTLEPDGFSLDDTTVDYLDSNLVFISVAGDAKYSVRESLVMEAIRHFFDNQKGQTLCDQYTADIINDSSSASSDGIKVEILIALYLASSKPLLPLPGGLGFYVTTSNIDYKWRASLPSWIRSRDSVLRVNPLDGTDIIFPLEVVGPPETALLATIPTLGPASGVTPVLPAPLIPAPLKLSSLFPEATKAAWVSFGVVASKTTEKPNQGVEIGPIQEALRTTSLLLSDARRKLDALEELFKISQHSNILFVRYNVALPYPSRNAEPPSTTNNSLVIPLDATPNTELLPPHGAVAYRSVTITFDEREVTIFELLVSVEMLSVAQLGLLSSSIAQELAKKFHPRTRAAHAGHALLKFPVQYVKWPAVKSRHSGTRAPPEESSGEARKRPKLG